MTSHFRWIERIASQIPLLAVILLMTAASNAQARDFTPTEPMGAATPWTREPAANSGALRFVIIGDRTGVARSGVFPQAMQQIAWLQPDFTISIGDLIEGYTEDAAEIDGQWDELLNAARASGGPFFAVPGNHDISNPVMAERWRKRFSRENYGFTYKGALFIVLNSEETPQLLPPTVIEEAHAMSSLATRDPDRYDQEMAQILAAKKNAAGPPAAPSELQGILSKLASEYQSVPSRGTVFSDVQISWLQGVVAKHRDAKWTFVFLHRPEWRSPDSGWNRVQAALGNRPYTVFAGHEHRYFHDVRDGHDYIQMGTTGGTAQRPGAGLMDHVLAVTLSGQKPSYANIRLNGLLDIDGNSGQTRAY
jgi:3',5'-cyclic AMP phosphodiesterase CpdA